MARVCAREGCYNLLPEFSTRKYCSNRCRQNAYRARIYKPQKEVVVIVKKCLNCGKEFRPVNSRQEFCKTSCRVNLYQQLKRLDQKEEN